jgi:methionyl aminopeptidase
MLELDVIAEDFIRSNGCLPTFKGYKRFPNSVCISVNDQLVHGICTDYKLKSGDVVSFDLGATYEGAIADTALTTIWGEPKSNDHVNIIAATKEALVHGILAAKSGARLGVIGNTIHKYSQSKGFKVIEHYGGHSMEEGIPHAQPFVPNKSDPNEGVRMTPNLTLAIEPMLVPNGCESKTKVGTDGWTVYTPGVIGAHEEHTIFIHDDYTEIITSREGLSV